MTRTPDNITLESLQQIVDNWISTIGHGYFSPLTNMAVLTEEVGEVARIMAREHGEQSWREGTGHPSLADELADVIWVVAAIANQNGIDLNEALHRNVDKKTRRDAARHAANKHLTGAIPNKE